MKIIKFLFVLLLFIQLFAVVSFAQSQEAQLRINITGIQSGETFEFVSGSNRFTFTTNGTTVWGNFPVGSNYNLTQSSGPRQCRSTNNPGTISSSGTTITFDCAARYSYGNVRVFGIEPGESFTFRKSNFGVSYQNGTHPLGNHLVGERYSFGQGSGPRQCVITNNPGIAPETDWTIVVDCSKPSPTPTPTPTTTTSTTTTLGKIDLRFQVTGIEAGETFNFKTHQITNGTDFTQSGTVKLGSYMPGSNYSVLQNGGPRQCRLSKNEGTMQLPEILVTADCNRPLQTATAYITSTGIANGETYTFNLDGWTVTLTSSKRNEEVRGLYVGRSYSFTQRSGPRQCRLSKNTITINANGAGVNVDCSQQTTTPTPPTLGTFGDFELISRNCDQISPRDVCLGDKKTFSTFFKSYPPSIGGVNDTGVTEGQFVTYVTSVAIDPNHDGKKRQVIWFNRGNGKTALVSQTPDGKSGDNDSFEPAISANGYQVVFESTATNLDAGDTNKVSDVFIWNLMNTSVSCISCSGNGASSTPSISGDGNTVAFTSYANNLTAGVDGTTVANVYVKNMRSGQTELISKDPKTGKGIGGRHPSVSEDGSRIAFYSFADKLVDNDKNNLWDIFVWERGNPKLKRISLTAEGMERDQGNESMSRIVKPTISGNGKYVAFSTTATNMGGGANGKTQQVYVVEIDTGRVVRASEGIENTISNGDSPIEQGEKIALSYDGKWVAFTTKSTNLGGNIIVKNIETGEIIPFKIEGYGGIATPSLSRSGKCIAFPASEKLDKRFDSSGVFVACR